MTNEKQYENMEPREKFEALWLEAGLHKRPGADALLYELEKQGSLYANYRGRKRKSAHGNPAGRKNGNG